MNLAFLVLFLNCFLAGPVIFTTHFWTTNTCTATVGTFASTYGSRLCFTYNNGCTINSRRVGPVTDDCHGFAAPIGIKHGTCQCQKDLQVAFCHKSRRVKYGSICQHQRTPLWHRRLCQTLPPLPNMTTSGKLPPHQRRLRLLRKSVAMMLSKHIPAFTAAR